MIRTDDGGFVPGSLDPPFRTVEFPPEVQEYVTAGGWQQGIGVLILGPPGCGKTTLGLSIMRAVYQKTQGVLEYWTERDFLADLRELWSLREKTQRQRSDIAGEDHYEWERRFWHLKESEFLFFDDACQSYTSMQWYETEGLLVDRNNQMLTTLVAVSAGVWGSAPAGIRSTLERNRIVVNMKAR